MYTFRLELEATARVLLLIRATPLVNAMRSRTVAELVSVLKWITFPDEGPSQVSSWASQGW